MHKRVSSGESWYPRVVVSFGIIESWWFVCAGE